MVSPRPPLARITLPRRLPDLLRRERLLSFLHENVYRKLILVSAAAGLARSAGGAAASVAGPSFVLTLVVYVVLIALAGEAVQLPLAFYQGVTLERRYGLSTQRSGRYWRGFCRRG